MKIYLLLLCVVLSSCVTSKRIELKTGIEQIHFGSSGGFTGEIKKYTVNSNGKLSEKEKEIKQIDRNKILSIFKKAQTLKKYSFNEPENMSLYIEIQTKDTTNNVVWGIGSTKINNAATELYNQLMSLIK